MTNWLASIESRPVGHQDLRVQHGLFQGRLEHVKQVWTGTTWVFQVSKMTLKGLSTDEVSF